MQQLELSCDITVVGGGLAGVCAAIAAARQGRRVTLIQNRPVLGGNSSSEVRVWVCGATAHGSQSFARETGIMGELWLENQYRNAEGNPYYWDLVVLDAVKSEPNITLLLNTDVREIATGERDGVPVIESVTGWQMGSEKSITVTAPTVIDCSGDGLIGFLAGADHALGREAFEVYQEPWAPEVPDADTLGSTILFYSKDAGEPSPFIPPRWAVDVAATSIPEHRVISATSKGCAYWWIEWGGELDVVDDNERIRDELQAVVYGIWDHIKNSGEFENVENLTLEWIGSVPGKREYRRFLGDHVLTQHDVLDQTPFDDAVTFGGWSIDLHPPGGVYATESGSKHWYSDGVYPIPLRSLYSRNVGNLWMAGRNISASHVAFGTTRVMATCAAIGEAAGLAAAVAQQHGLTARELATERFGLMHDAMIRNDTSTVGLPNRDRADVARHARVTASSTRTLPATQPDGDQLDLSEVDLGLVLPADPRLGRIELLIDADVDLELVVEVHAVSRPQNYVPARLLRTVSSAVTAGAKQWVELDLDHEPDEPEHVFCVVRATAGLRLWTATEALPGTECFRRRELPPEAQWSEQFREWKQTLGGSGPVLRFVEPTAIYAAEHVLGGFARPYGGPRLWSSVELTSDPTPELIIEWDESQELTELQLVLDDDVRIDLINLHHHRTPFPVIPTLLRDYDLQVRDGGTFRTVAEVRDNRHRHARHRLDAPVRADAVRLRVLATHGSPHAHVIAVRAYADR